MGWGTKSLLIISVCRLSGGHGGCVCFGWVETGRGLNLAWSTDGHEDFLHLIMKAANITLVLLSEDTLGK